MNDRIQANCDHEIGTTGQASLTSMNDPAILDYIERVQYFNAHTARFQVNHPGHLNFHKFCPHCGKALPFEQHEAKFQQLLHEAGGFDGGT